MTLRKADLIDSMYNQVGLSKTKSSEVVESLVEIIKKTLENGEDAARPGSLLCKPTLSGVSPQVCSSLLYRSPPRAVHPYRWQLKTVTLRPSSESPR